MPSLLIGMIVAETLSLSLSVPLIWVNHIEAHMFANLIERNIEDLVFPSVVLTVSG
jgi:N6-L-threonylcarbamoyladenine synthase